MESPSAPAHRGLVPWQGLLLAASLLTFWSLPTTAQLTIESVPPNAVAGKDVLLRVHNLPGDLGSYNWYKGTTGDNNKIGSYVIDTQTTVPGPAYSGREKIYPNGSLLLQIVTLNYTGYYILQTIDKYFQMKQATGELRVYQSVGKPSLRATNATVTEHKDIVVLTCLTNDMGISIRWLFKNQILLLTDRMKLSQDNRTLTIDPVRKEDAGNYQCEVFNPVSSGISDPFRLDVQSEQTYTGYSVGTIVGGVIGALIVAALGASLGYFLYLRRSRRASDPRGLQEHPPPAATPGQGPSESSAFPGPLPERRTAGPIYEELLNPNTEAYCRVIPRADVAS